MVLPVVETNFDPVTTDEEQEKFDQMFENAGKKLRDSPTRPEPELPSPTVETSNEPRDSMIFLVPTYKRQKPKPPTA